MTSLAAEAAALARQVLARGGDVREAGLLDADVPEEVAVEVGYELGRAALPTALSLVRTDPARAAAFAGAGDALVDVGVGYARDRVVFGRPLARFQVQRHAFALATARVAAARALARRAAAVGDPVDLAVCVPVAADAAWLAAETALQVHGGYGYTDEYPVSRMWLDVALARAAVTRPAVPAT